ncbi:MAG: hypothetical protein CVV49_05620 [Spirochaetae bacterium HGW-Spirochaetae-5]|nr:MAG: hypothetical protein CVV49_05620 [Spirochaetae bacterium HGW-Spirochaetae-5]
MKKTLTILLFFSIIITGMAEVKEFKKFQLLPIDDSAADKEFYIYIQKFKTAVKSRNLTTLRNLIAHDVAFTFESQDGINGLIKLWNLDRNPQNSKFWYEMDKVLSMGSSFYDENKTTQAYPYLFVIFPADYDSHEYSAVTGKKVNVRQTPSSKSPVIETLDYEIVKTAWSAEDTVSEKVNGINGTWVKVQTSTGKTGYVFSHYIHSPIGPRAIFEKRSEGWVLTAFVSGD